MKKLSSILALILCATAFAHAQQPPQLSLDEAIQTALKNNHDLDVARLAIHNADAQVDEAFSNALPTVSVSAQYRRNIERPVFYIPGQNGVVNAVSIGADNVFNAGLDVSQVVFNSAVLKGVGTAETFAKISRQQLRSKTADVVANVKRAYYSAMLARELLRVNETLLANAEINYQTTLSLTRGGVRAEFDAIRAEVQAANQRPAVVQARNNYEMALDQLKILLGYDDTQEVEIGESLVRPASLAAVEPTLVDAKKTLEEANSQIQTLRLSSEVNEQLIDINRSDYMPTVSVFGHYQYEAQADAFSDLSFQPTLYLGLNVGLNLFNGGKTQAKVEQATILAEQSKLQLRQVTSALKTQLESVLRRIEYARERIGVSDKVIAQAERGYQIATASYKAGAGTQLQINDADLALAQSKLNQLSAVYDYYMAMADLEQLLGERYQVTPDGGDVQYSSR